jgi:hypothetical protein
VGAAKGLADREMVVIHALGGSGPSGTTTGLFSLVDSMPMRRREIGESENQ